MTPTLRHKVLVVLAAVAATVGVIDTAMSRQWDLVAVFALVLVPLVGLLVTLGWGKQVVPVRRDLAAWLRDRSALTGEPLSTVADRAIAAQRAALGEDDRADSEPAGGGSLGPDQRTDPP
jgi:hypothetical protein